MRDPFFIHDIAQRRLPRIIYDFIVGGTGAEMAAENNEAALERVKLTPRALINIEDVDMSTSLLGQTYSVPFGVAPMGMCNLIAPNADRTLSQNAAIQGFPHCVSTVSSTTLEDTFLQAQKNAWFQLYAGTNKDLTWELVDRAAQTGYEHLVYTVDTPHHSRRTRDLENGFSVPLKICFKQFVDFALHPRWSIFALFAGTPKPMNFVTSKIERKFNRNDSRGGVDWDFLAELRKRWHGKLILKGIMSPDDAVTAKQSGCDAVYVSNHGGRQLDSSLASIEVLPRIRDAVGNDFTLVFDSGIRSADDIVRALALGANFVMIGRPILLAIAAGKLDSYLDLMTFDLRSVIAQLGATKIEHLNKNVLATKSED